MWFSDLFKLFGGDYNINNTKILIIKDLINNSEGGVVTKYYYSYDIFF